MTMMTSDSTATPRSLLNVTSEGGALRRAVTRYQRVANDLANTIRKSIPFLARRGVKVIPSPATPTTFSDLCAALEGPIYVAQLAIEPGGTKAALLFDAGSIAYLLEGMLGGDGNSAPSLSPEGLTPPQAALVSRIADHLLQGLSSVCESGIGFRLSRLPAHGPEVPGDATFISIRLQLGADEVERRIVLAISKDALIADTVKSSGPTLKRRDEIDPRVVATVENVELELVAELGKVRMTLGELSELRVGDTLRLDVPVNGVVMVRAEDRVLLEGHPTTSGTQIAIRVARRHAI